MNKFLASLALILIFNFCVICIAQPRLERAPTGKTFLRNNWQIQSSAKVDAKGDRISQPEFEPKSWYPATVPSTVVGTLVEDKVFPDPFFGMNLRAIPGCSYPVGSNFSLRPMPDDSPFKSSWWYRTEFQTPTHDRGDNIWLHLDGINFRANVWLNGKQIATSDQIAGTFRLHVLNVGDVLRAGRPNALAIEVFPQQPDDLGWTWVDWNPMPPDKNMGLFRDVYLATSGPITLRYPQVVTHFDLPSLTTAHLTVNVQAENASVRETLATLSGRIGDVRFSQTVKLGPQETKDISFTPAEFSQLNIRYPRVWWPIHLGPQNLYELRMQVEAAGKLSDHQQVRFGIREITSEMTDKNHLTFKVNGRKILIRGGGWASDMFLRFNRQRLRREFQYVKDMNLNTIRLEGQLQPDYFFDLADENGILVMAGWCCCSHWEHWQLRDDYKEGTVWDKEDYEIAAKSQSDQIRRLRSHPSLLVWLNGSDNPPPPDVEQMYIDILKKNSWPNPFLSSATAKPTTVTGVTGVKMEGPYEWVPPSYWLLDKKLGGAYGFATEISPGPAVPPVESLRQMLPADHLWPIDDIWSYHAGGGQFKTLTVFTEALNARYGPARDVDNYALKSQLIAYEGQRAMFEAYGANRYTSTGVIQWMLNNAWPSMIWHLYDYFLRPGGGYFGTKKACEPVHAQYSYDDKSIVVVNTTQEAIKNARLTVRVYDFQLSQKFSKDTILDLPVDSTLKPFVIPQIEGISQTYFLKLILENEKGQTISSNFYWLSTRDDVLDWQKSTWYYTPATSYADMTQLEKLQPTKVAVSSRPLRSDDEDIAHVTVSNPSLNLAFFIHLQIKQENGDREVLPVIWSDNYFSLLPGESKDVTARYQLSEGATAAPFLSVEGWNVSRLKVPLRTVRRR